MSGMSGPEADLFCRVAELEFDLQKAWDATGVAPEWRDVKTLADEIQDQKVAKDDLLEACQATLIHLNNVEYTCIGTEEVILMLEAAIAKVRGYK